MPFAPNILAHISKPLPPVLADNLLSCKGLYITPEALQDIQMWMVDRMSEETFKEILFG